MSGAKTIIIINPEIYYKILIPIMKRKLIQMKLICDKKILHMRQRYFLGSQNLIFDLSIFKFSVPPLSSRRRFHILEPTYEIQKQSFADVLQNSCS